MEPKKSSKHGIGGIHSEKLRKQKYDLDDELLKPYFELYSVRKGLFDVAGKLFGLSFKERFDIPKPHEDASTFEVLDEDERIGQF